MSNSAMVELGRQAKAASRVLAAASTAEKDAALKQSADLLEERSEQLIAANLGDLSRADADGLTSAQLDRLALNAQRVHSMAEGLRSLTAQPDPVGQVVEGWVRPNGLRVERVRVPLGVVGVIYENRPNVTSDAAGLCLKSGNAILLRGSASAIDSNRLIVEILSEAIAKAGLPERSVQLVDDTSRASAVEFMQLREAIDCLIPRGGKSLLDAIREHATVPTVLDGDGNCHLYVDRAADLDLALSVLVNSKTHRPGVCNALETLLVHKDVAAEFLPCAQHALGSVKLFGDDRTRQILPGIEVATDEEFATEFLALELAVAVVDDLQGAVDHIARFGSGHSEAVVTTDIRIAEQFCRQVDAAAVLVNTSTRFVDGEQLGLGAEIGISTQKLHARGPMGLRELTCVKYVIHGEGQVRS